MRVSKIQFCFHSEFEQDLLYTNMLAILCTQILIEYIFQANATFTNFTKFMRAIKNP